MLGRPTPPHWPTPRRSHRNQADRGSRTPTKTTRRTANPRVGGVRTDRMPVRRRQGSVARPHPCREAAPGEPARAPRAERGEAPAQHRREDSRLKRSARPPGAAWPPAAPEPARAGRSPPQWPLSARGRAPTQRVRMGGAPDARRKGPPHRGGIGNGGGRERTAVPPRAEGGRRSLPRLPGGPRVQTAAPPRAEGGRRSLPRLPGSARIRTGPPHTVPTPSTTLGRTGGATRGGRSRRRRTRAVASLRRG